MTKDHGFRYALGEPLSQRSMRWLSKLAVANSKAVWDHYSPPIPSEKMRLIYYAIDGFKPSPNNIDLPVLRVLLLGKQAPSKGQHLALAAAGILKSEPIQAHFRLVGTVTPTYRKELQELSSELGISDSVEIVDATSTPQDEFAWANVVLMCSHNEAFGRVTVEALKSGRPVIGTNSGGTADLIRHGVDGFLFEPRNPDELASAIRTLASEPGLLARMSENARIGSADRFTIESEVEAFVDVLATAVARQKHHPQGAPF
jgi:glycosyltransferase involved in cell wall biosynthesis